MGVVTTEQWKCTDTVGAGREGVVQPGALSAQKTVSLANNSSLATGMNSHLSYSSSTMGRG